MEEAITPAIARTGSVTKEADDDLILWLQEHSTRTCTRCKAIKTITEMSYSIDSVIRALDKEELGLISKD